MILSFSRSPCCRAIGVQEAAPGGNACALAPTKNQSFSSLQHGLTMLLGRKAIIRKHAYFRSSPFPSSSVVAEWLEMMEWKSITNKKTVLHIIAWEQSLWPSIYHRATRCWMQTLLFHRVFAAGGGWLLFRHDTPSFSPPNWIELEKIGM
jgi:hypothetical protein